MKSKKNLQIPDIDIKNRAATKRFVDNVRNGMFRNSISIYDNATVPESMADFILKSFKIGGISPRLKPTTSPFNFNLPDTLRDYLEYRCSTTFSNMTKYLIDIINNDMDNLPINGGELPLADLCEKDPEMAAKVIRFTVAQFDRLGCIETVAVNRNPSPYVSVGKDGRVKHDVYNDPYGDLAKAIKSMANNNESGAEFDSVICHPDLEQFIRECIKDTPWQSAKIITVTEDILRYNIIFLKKYRMEVFALKKSDQLMAEQTDDHGEYFYDEESLKSWLKSNEEKEGDKSNYRIVENVNAAGKSSFVVEKKSHGTWTYYESAPSFEVAQNVARLAKENDTVKRIIHEL
mgnify:CR=1 FL=1